MEVAEEANQKYLLTKKLQHLWFHWGDNEITTTFFEKAIQSKDHILWHVSYCMLMKNSYERHKEFILF